MKMRSLLCMMLMIACVGLSQAAVVSWDGTSADIVDLGSNINSSPNSWAVENTIWGTTDEVVPAVGSQASFKAAIAKIPAQRKIAQINAGGNNIAVNGNELGETPFNPDHSPYCTMLGFDTAAFGSTLFNNASVNIKSRPNDSGGMDVRWFIEAGGNTYVSGVVANLGQTATTLTLADASAIAWHDFDSTVNIESAISDANDLLGNDVLTAVTRVGVYTASYFTANANWHGPQIYNFSAMSVSKIASEPSPEDGTFVLDTPILGWTAGSTAIAHDVYLDTVNPPVAFEKRVTTASYDPNTTLAPGIYYWRVDEVEDPNIPVVIYEGDVWSFEIANPGLATNPIPADEATGVDAVPTLSWTAGVDAISHDVWFGKSPDALTLVSNDQAETTYASGALIKGETYYWAVDEYDGTNIHIGLTWSFTVETTSGTTNWTNGSDPNDNLWTNEDNWSDGVPGLTSQANIKTNGPALIDDSVDAAATGNWCRWGIPDTDPNADTDSIVLEMTGGSLSVKSLALGNGGPATVNITGGTLSTSGNLIVGDNEGADTTLNMDGGTINIGAALMSKANTAANFVNLNGGVLSARDITLNAGSDPNLGTTIDIAGGALILKGDEIDEINGYVDSGWIVAYGGTGKVVLVYDEVADETTVIACADPDITDLTNDCAVDMDDLELVIEDWLFKAPANVAWSFDMASDPTGTGLYDLNVREPIEVNANYTMGDDTGTGTLEATGAGNLLLDQHFPVRSGSYDMTVHYVVKSTSVETVNLWVTIASSASLGEQAYVGISTKSDAGEQTVEIWNGDPPHVAGYTPVVATGFSADDYLDITVNYDYETDTYDWTISDDSSTQNGTAAYTAFAAGPGGSYTLQAAAPSTALVDQLDITIDGCDWISAGDIQPDGSVDLIDFAGIASYWMVTP